MSDRGEPVVCRARVHADCLHGAPVSDAYEGRLDNDGTFDGSSVVCDACYVALMPFTPSGGARHHELPDAIRAARGA